MQVKTAADIAIRGNKQTRRSKQTNSRSPLRAGGRAAQASARACCQLLLQRDGPTRSREDLGFKFFANRPLAEHRAPAHDPKWWDPMGRQNRSESNASSRAEAQLRAVSIHVTRSIPNPELRPAARNTIEAEGVCRQQELDHVVPPSSPLLPSCVVCLFVCLCRFASPHFAYAPAYLCARFPIETTARPSSSTTAAPLLLVALKLEPPVFFWFSVERALASFVCPEAAHLRLARRGGSRARRRSQSSQCPETSPRTLLSQPTTTHKRQTTHQPPQAS